MVQTTTAYLVNTELDYADVGMYLCLSLDKLCKLHQLPKSISTVRKHKAELLNWSMNCANGGVLL